MEKIKLVTDSACDISYENEKRYGIQIIPFKLAIGEKSYISRIDFDNIRFYQLLEESNSIPATSQITPFEFADVFEESYEAGYTDVIYVSINSAGSATYANAVFAAQEFYEDHPDAKEKFFIRNIDSGLYTGCYGFGVVEAAKMIENGANAHEIERFLQDWCKNTAACFAPYTLKYAAKSGRIPAIAAQMGNLLNIKPIMRVFDHEIKTVRKIRSEKNIIGAIIETILADMVPGTQYCVIYGNDTTVRDEMASQLEQALGYPPTDRYQIGEAIAINAGPKVVGVIYRRNAK